ncbi:MAG: enolase C-terminal domain-like protein, partial [Planctomycetota bacterium]
QIGGGIGALLLGTDAREVGKLHDRMRRHDRHGRSGAVMCGISALDLALWDLAGVRQGVPVCELLGGPVRRSVPCYVSTLGARHDAAAVTSRVAAFAADGWAGQKWFFAHGPASGDEGVRANLTLAECVRSGAGEADVMFDAYNGWDEPYARRMCKLLESTRPRWLEEPIFAEQVTALAELRRSTSIPIATGEHVYGRWHTLELLRAGAVDVLQKDPGWTGGLTEQVAICELARGFGVPVVAHGHAVLPALHVACAQPPDVVPMLEYLPAFAPERHHFLEEKCVPVAGELTAPTAPGLGMQLDHANIADRRVITEHA